jgi:hypothetical protein
MPGEPVPSGGWAAKIVERLGATGRDARCPTRHSASTLSGEQGSRAAPYRRRADREGNGHANSDQGDGVQGLGSLLYERAMKQRKRDDKG